MLSRLFFYIVLFLIFFLTISNRDVFATATAEAEVSQRLVALGIPFQVKVIVSVDDGESVERPRWPNIDGLLLVNPNLANQVSIDIRNGVSRQSYIFWAEYNSQKTGTFEISPIKISVRKNGAAVEEITANAVTVEVFSDAPKPASGIFISKGFPWQKLFITILILAAIGGLFAYWRHLRKSMTDITPAPLILAPTKTLEQKTIEAINGVAIPSSQDTNAVKEYYQTIDGILRNYLSEKYEIHTTDLTLWELISSLGKSNKMDARSQDIIKILNDCNWVKYAKMHPTDDEIREIPARCIEALTGVRS